MMIESRQINVHIFKNFELDEIFLHADWSKFKLAIFNLIQNSIKYNYGKGDIVFIFKLNKLTSLNKEIQQIESMRYKDDEKSQEIKFNKMLTVEIIDTGLGIDEER